MATSNPESAHAQPNEQFEFFWQSDSYFSQWYPSKFTVDGTTYSCAEQYMMHQKALCCKDYSAAKQIMNSDHPRQMKQLGRSIKNWETYGDTWEQTCYDVVKKGNIHKFSQIPELKEALVATKGKILVEASPYDKKWGIGLTADSPLAWSKSTWEGKNLLGYALTEVRDELIANEGVA